MANLTKLTDTYELNNGIKIPIVGFGTWQTPDGDVAEKSVEEAIAAGYRHIDTAFAYQNEKSVGKGIKDSGVARDQLWVTSKLTGSDHSYENAKKAIDTSLNNLGLDYLDLYLIHWPNPVAFRDNWEQANAETWRAMEEAQKAGKIRAIGVSNFRPKHLDALLKTATVTPQVNQIFLNPSDLQPEVVAYNKAHNILSEAYSPLGTGKIFGVEELKTMSEKYGKTVAQVVLRWSLQHGFLPLPKSVHEERIVENTKLFDFAIDENDMKKIDGLRGVAGLATDPDTITW
ncbi:aldo/keto reductase [Pediococcus ethanolidurans]|uniref:Aldo keto reductase of diketogulonate reductase family protein n=1 Tax=Pediococcus ethanolidurans TaxID=319653 RepID=A0A0R2K8S2_9LACO|nr:aldo/keto reductase [Pediococcus ethanolidurans]KRN82676.1 aldo keto reductase of diketogulonate reductase family protein [Pediococcus ethanolidurans]GEN94913.1 2,5-diketo-D-gluconic acid reductase [Pediococcus ethanolidurans]SER46927.1 Aldo/keto reductase [Pediococcus ethanolidurans]